MDRLLQIIVWAALAGATFVILFPPWNAQWVVVYPCRYVYANETRLPDGGGAGEYGEEREEKSGTHRGFLLSGPRLPEPRVPEARIEDVGTGFVALGPRRTAYLGAENREVRSHVSLGQTIWELTVVLGTAVVFIAMNRRKTAQERRRLDRMLRH